VDDVVLVEVLDVVMVVVVVVVVVVEVVVVVVVVVVGRVWGQTTVRVLHRSASPELVCTVNSSVVSVRTAL
jgi:hypothetical protein